MTPTPKDARVYFLGNPEKPHAASVMDDLVAFAQQQGNFVGVSLELDTKAAVAAKADRIVVLGGDGTLIGAARTLQENQIPLIGVNVGKFGFLAEFSPDELRQHYDAALTDRKWISHRTALHVTVRRGEQTTDLGMAINDCVIQAGPPFRMVTLGVSVNDERLTEVRGDGIIVCTPSGSTAHNLSAGGPIVQPGVDAIVLTPLNAHSLTHKPLVVERESVIEIHAAQVNEGTTAIIDGQVSCPLEPGDRVTVRRFATDFMLVRNPSYAKWHKLTTKLHWGQAPNYD